MNIMAKATKTDIVVTEDTNSTKIPTIHDLEWTDYVLSRLSEDEKINGNPTTDGLRRIFEDVLNCTIIGAHSHVIQSPNPDNEKRATVEFSLEFIINDPSVPDNSKFRSVMGSADVYWGNCDKVYRNHPVAVAETRAEGRALRRGLRLRKVVAAEEIAKDIEDHPDGDSVSKISNNQLNFMDVLGKRLDVNLKKLLLSKGFKDENVYNITHVDAIDLIKNLSSYQQDSSIISEDIKGYDANWK